jgi:menaquinone-dependent protoporphyrinogen oxidase
MDNKILVTYSSKYGATAEIAERIAAILQKAGHAVDVLPVKNVREAGSYRAVILGCATYMGFWRKNAVRFLTMHEQVLAGCPFWLFSSGPTGEGDPLKLMNGWRVPNAQQELIDRIQPREITIFHGKLEDKKLNFFEKWIIRRVNARMGDFRDWAMIDSWAASIGEALK